MSLTGKPGLTTVAAIDNDGFWPTLQIADLMDKYRIPSEYADGVISTGLLLAMVRVNSTLEPVKQAILTLGHVDLTAYIAALPARQIGGIDVLITEYENAVFSRAKAGLLMQFKAINRRPQAENAAKEDPEMEVYWLDESQRSIKAFFDALLPAQYTPSKASVYSALL